MNKLLIKAGNNREIGLVAEEKKYFDVAISRFYYEIYQKILLISIVEGIDETAKGEKNVDISHATYIKNFLVGIYNKRNPAPEEMRYLNKLYNLRKQRNTSDYDKDNYIDNEDDYLKSFYRDYYNAKKVIDKLLSKIGGNAI